MGLAPLFRRPWRAPFLGEDTGRAWPSVTKEGDTQSASALISDFQPLEL